MPTQISLGERRPFTFVIDHNFVVNQQLVSIDISLMITSRDPSSFGVLYLMHSVT